MGGRPITALNIVAFPRNLSMDILGEILAGGATKAAEAGVAIVGGHSVNDAEPKYGIAVTGIVNPKSYIRNSGARPGDRLVLTKAIGTGVITTAGKGGKVAPEVLAGAVASMTMLNRAASEAMLEAGVNAATDITGFGLLGHLKSMAAASGASAKITVGAVPLLNGATELAAAGVVPGGTKRNAEALGDAVRWHPSLSSVDRILMCDAQTSGGLLIAVAQDRLEPLVAALMRRGVGHSAVVGEVLDGRGGHDRRHSLKGARSAQDLLSASLIRWPSTS